MANPLSDADIERIRAAIQAGRKIEAIKLYREASGEGLYEAKVFIEALERRLDGIQPASRALSDDELQPIRAAIFAGYKIEAIKLYRQKTGEGLYEAKQFVERLEAALRQSEPQSFTTPPAKGCGTAALCVLVLFGVLVTVLAR